MDATGSAGVMTPAQFIAKWSPVTLSERAASRYASSITNEANRTGLGQAEEAQGEPEV